MCRIKRNEGSNILFWKFDIFWRTILEMRYGHELTATYIIKIKRVIIIFWRSKTKLE